MQPSGAKNKKEKKAHRKITPQSTLNSRTVSLREDDHSQAHRQLTLSKFVTSEQGSFHPPIASYVPSGTSTVQKEKSTVPQYSTPESVLPPQPSPRAKSQHEEQQQAPQQQQPVVDTLCPAVRKMGYSSSSNNVVGEGAFSRVFRARSNKIPYRDIAVKIVRLDDPNIPQAWKEYSMKRELKILKKVRHPNVITIYDVIKTRTRIYIFMDLAAASVSSHLEATEEPASEQTARNWFGGISNAIAYLHQIEIAHRDLKNDNILIDSNGQAKLTDFGFACFTYDRKTRTEALSTTSCGTKAYVAPEVFNPPYNAKMADVWSLGVCLYECTTLLQPFRDDLPNQIFIRRQIEKGLVIPRRLQSKLSDLLQDLLHRMIEPDLNKRLHSEAILVHPWMRMPR